MKNLVVEVNNLSKSFTDVTALDGLELTVKPGVFGLVGPNGAGKTTLLRILLGLARPSSGHASVMGLDVVGQSYEIRQRIGVLHERASFPRAMRVSSYLAKVIRLYGGRNTPDELLETVGLSYASNRSIGKLSAGMHQRLGLAQAFAGNPELVFLDEPTANLDVQGRREIIDTIVQMHRESGVSFFIASHILSELERTCHSLAFIRNGKILDSGSMAEILSRYTQGIWKIRTSDPGKLATMATGLPAVRAARVSGSTLVTVIAHKEQVEGLEEKLWNLGSSDDLEVFMVEPATALEEAYEAVMDSA